MISPPSTVANVPAVIVKVSPSASVSFDCNVAVELYNTSEVAVAESSTATGVELQVNPNVVSLAVFVSTNAP